MDDFPKRREAVVLEEDDVDTADDDPKGDMAVEREELPDEDEPDNDDTYDTAADDPDDDTYDTAADDPDVDISHATANRVTDVLNTESGRISDMLSLEECAGKTVCILVTTQNIRELQSINRRKREEPFAVGDSLLVNVEITDSGEIILRSDQLFVRPITIKSDDHVRDLTIYENRLKLP